MTTTLEKREREKKIKINKNCTSLRSWILYRPPLHFLTSLSMSLDQHSRPFAQGHRCSSTFGRMQNHLTRYNLDLDTNPCHCTLLLLLMYFILICINPLVFRCTDSPEGCLSLTNSQLHSIIINSLNLTYIYKVCVCVCTCM